MTKKNQLELFEDKSRSFHIRAKDSLITSASKIAEEKYGMSLASLTRSLWLKEIEKENKKQ